jgi:PIN domain nuclease of toxin-antitoxin system
MWLYDGLVEKLSPLAADSIERGRLTVCGIVELELQYLHEIGRIRPLPAEVLGALSSSIGLARSERTLAEVAAFACRLDWTRDPFDRMIAAEAMLSDGILITRDETLRGNCAAARW